MDLSTQLKCKTEFPAFSLCKPRGRVEIDRKSKNNTHIEYYGVKGS